LVAVFTVHLPYGFSSIKLTSVTGGRAQFGPPGFEVDLLYLACLAALVFAGSGPLGVDEYLRRKSGPSNPTTSTPTVGPSNPATSKQSTILLPSTATPHL